MYFIFFLKFQGHSYNQITVKQKPSHVYPFFVVQYPASGITHDLLGSKRLGHFHLSSFTRCGTHSLSSWLRLARRHTCPYPWWSPVSWNRHCSWGYTFTIASPGLSSGFPTLSHSAKPELFFNDFFNPLFMPVKPILSCTLPSLAVSLSPLWITVSECWQYFPEDLTLLMMVTTDFLQAQLMSIHCSNEYRKDLHRLIRNIPWTFFIGSLFSLRFQKPGLQRLHFSQHCPISHINLWAFNDFSSLKFHTFL